MWQLPFIWMLTTAATSVEDMPRAVTHEVSVSLGAVQYSAFGPAPPRAIVEAIYNIAPWTASPWRNFRLGAGGRVALVGPRARHPYEGFLRGMLRGEVGTWTPEIGVELGLSGLTDVAIRPGVPTEAMDAQLRRMSPFYAAFHTAPLRWRTGGWSLSALELQFGTTLSPPGGAGRLHLALFRVGKSL